MTDISIEDVKKKSNLNIYEAIVIMSKRARQINDMQKLEIMEQNQDAGVPDNRDNEDFDEVEIDREALEREYKKYPKPSTVAMAELMDKDIEYRKIEPEPEEGGAEVEVDADQKERKSERKTKKA